MPREQDLEAAVPEVVPAHVRQTGALEERLEVPVYSPDLNSIEEAFAKVKGLLRRAGSRTHRVLIEAWVGR